MGETSIIRETSELGVNGRITIPDKVREAVDVKGKKAYCQIENYGKDKVLITILNRWQPSHRGPGKDVVKKP